jgi:GlpG protein
MRVIQTSLEEDISVFSRYLWQQRVTHRVFEERGSQILEVADPAHASVVRDAFDAWRSGRLRLEAPTRPPPAAPSRWRYALARYPALTVIILLAVVVFPFSYPLAEGRLTDVAAWLMIVDPQQARASLPPLTQLLAQLEIWRWFTPMFLHFSVLHLGFNCAITVELGRRVEGGVGSLGLLGLVMALAGGSNLAQYAFGGGPLFGGLSGVAYGLLGYILAMNRLQPGERAWQLPSGLSVSLVLFLVIFTTGITEPFGLHVANAAHWSGLLGGIVLGAAHGRWRRQHV